MMDHKVINAGVSDKPGVFTHDYLYQPGINNQTQLLGKKLTFQVLPVSSVIVN